MCLTDLKLVKLFFPINFANSEVDNYVYFYYDKKRLFSQIVAVILRPASGNAGGKSKKKKKVGKLRAQPLPPFPSEGVTSGGRDG